MFVGSKLYERENLFAYMDFLPTAFLEYGFPLQLYVDFHSFFFTSKPDSLTVLGSTLKFYDVSFRYASTPRAKGKVERDHQYWQGRVPIGSQRIRIEVPPRVRVVLCTHPSGHQSVIAKNPDKSALPVMLFSNRPQ